MRKCLIPAVVLCLLLPVGCAGRKMPPHDAPVYESETAPVSQGEETSVNRPTESVETTAEWETPNDTRTDTDAESDVSHETLPEINRAEMETDSDTTPAESDAEEETAVHYVSVKNPVVSTAADPWVVEHEGRYYYCRSFNGKRSGVTVSEISSPHALSNEGGTKVYTAPEGTAYSAQYWAPELHYIDGAWYIYVAADDGSNETHRMYVLRGTTQDPTDPFEMVGQITDGTNKWAIDGTVLRVGGELYFVWSGWAGDVNVSQSLYIAHMSDPCTVDSERVRISSPAYDWERVGFPTVNEGPAALYHGEDVFLIYSASGSWTDSYCLGMLTLVGNDPMNPEAWQKSAEPVLASQPPIAYGPGHCSFTTAVDGSVWMVFHANRESGTGWSGRSGWISPVTFTEDGMPVFGELKRRIRFPISIS